MVSQAKAKGKRARKDEDKQARRARLLDAALALWTEKPYTDITMADVARETGLAKGTLYLYFQTKEELFLAALERLLWTWFGGVDADLTVQRTGTPATVAATLAASLEGQGAMLRLLTLLNSTLEQNIPLEVGLAFKARLGEHLARTGTQLERLLPSLAPGQGAQALLHFSALAIGLHTVTESTPTLRAAAEQPGMEALILDFTAELETALTALLIGSQRSPA